MTLQTLHKVLVVQITGFLLPLEELAPARALEGTLKWASVHIGEAGLLMPIVKN
jgi:hypothetical protein